VLDYPITDRFVIGVVVGEPFPSHFFSDERPVTPVFLIFDQDNGYGHSTGQTLCWDMDDLVSYKKFKEHNAKIQDR